MIAPGSLDRIRGAILGAVVGDAFGGPLEGASVSDMPRLVAARIARPAPWSYTDDGAMNLAVAESLVTAGTVDPVHLLGRFAAHYEPARGFGRGMKLALRAFESGTPWDRCAFAAWPEGSRGNGGAVRITPVACVSWSSPAMFERAIDRTTKVTHTHEEAVSAARVQAHAVALAREARSFDLDPQAFLAELRRRTRELPPWVEAALLAVGDLLRHDAAPRDASRALGCSPLARESVFPALWAFLSGGESYVAAITAAALLGGDVDSICAMTGALAGASRGVTAIPEAWLRNLDHESPTVGEMLALCGRLDHTAPRDLPAD